jgi:hypothetical protein
MPAGHRGPLKRKAAFVFPELQPAERRKLGAGILKLSPGKASLRNEVIRPRAVTLVGFGILFALSMRGDKLAKDRHTIRNPG